MKRAGLSPEMSEISDPFTEMARRIELNAEQGYGGAFVIVPPGDEVKPRVMLMLNNAEDPAMFWGSLMTTCQMALREIQQEAEQNSGFGGMRR